MALYLAFLWGDGKFSYNCHIIYYFIVESGIIHEIELIWNAKNQGKHANASFLNKGTPASPWLVVILIYGPALTIVVVISLVLWRIERKKSLWEAINLGAFGR